MPLHLLAQPHPPLQPLLDALAWGLFLRPETLDGALAWLEASLEIWLERAERIIAVHQEPFVYVCKALG